MASLLLRNIGVVKKLITEGFRMKNILVLAFVLLVSLISAVSVQAETEILIHSGWSFANAEMDSVPCIFCRDPIIVPPFTFTTEAGNSPVFGFKVAYFLNNRAGIEGGFSIAPNHTVTTSNVFECPPGMICPLALFPFFLSEHNMVTYQYDANFVYNILTGDVQPYITIGVGGISSDLETDVRSDFVLNYGGGAKFWFNKFGLRFELNDHVIPNYFLTEETEHNIQVQYGFLFKL